jgi:hypothetical protein
MSLSGEIQTSRYRGRPIGHAFSSAIQWTRPIPAITPKADSRRRPVNFQQRELIGVFRRSGSQISQLVFPHHARVAVHFAL